MPVKLFIITISLFLSVAITNAQRTSTFPSPIGFVNDYEKDFTDEQEKNLDYAVKELLAQTMLRDSLKGIELTIVTVTDKMYGDEKEFSSYVTRLGDKWGVADKGENKAIIIAYGQKIRKVTIVTGAALDNILPPAACHRIVDEKMAPAFRKGNYYEAILEAVKSIKEGLGL